MFNRWSLRLSRMSSTWNFGTAVKSDTFMMPHFIVTTVWRYGFEPVVLSSRSWSTEGQTGLGASVPHFIWKKKKIWYIACDLLSFLSVEKLFCWIFIYVVRIYMKFVLNALNLICCSYWKIEKISAPAFKYVPPVLGSHKAVLTLMLYQSTPG